MNDTPEQANSSEGETQPMATTNHDSIGAGIQLEEVANGNVWEAYVRWRTPRE